MIDRFVPFVKYGTVELKKLGFRLESEAKYSVEYVRQDKWKARALLQPYDAEPILSVISPDIHKEYEIWYLSRIFQEIHRQPMEVSSFDKSCSFLIENADEIFAVPQNYRKIYGEKGSARNTNYPEVSKTIWPYTATLKSKW